MQKEFLWQNYLADNPKLKSKIENVQYDDDFNEEWDKLDPSADSQQSELNDEDEYLEDDELLNEMAKKAYEELQENDNTKMEPARDRLKKANIKIDDVTDWEEEDED